MTAVLAILVAACATTIASPTVIPVATPAPATGLATNGVSSAEPTTAATPAGSAGPFVAANVQVTPVPFAKVPGSALAIAGQQVGSGRIFVATQEGQIWEVSATGQVAATPMLDISKEITTGGERGLLGLALPPPTSTYRRAVVNYTDLNGNTVIASFSMNASGNAFEPASEQVILRQQQPFPNHNGGGVAFARDDNLYIGLGDGGSGGDPNGNGQNLGTFLAKILRIDVEHAHGQAYAIPADNPFTNRAGAKPEVWLSGLRNPFRFSFDSMTGDLWIGDVGQDRWEEIDVLPAGSGGEDLGWNVMEGNHCYQPADGCDTTGLTRPVTEYGHDQGCAVIGGNVYRGEAYPQLIGAYLFSDSCSGTIWAIPNTTRSLTQPVPVGHVSGSPAGFGENAQGDLFVATLDGNIWKLTATSR
jgi:glucose/arabinose dehydrogenase